MSSYVFLIEAAEVPPGRAAPVRVGDRWFAVCNDGGHFHVVDHDCPHEGGSLAGGEVRDGCVICPVHAWPFDLQTGLTDERMPWMRLRRYPCELRDGRVFADVTAPLRT